MTRGKNPFGAAWPILRKRLVMPLTVLCRPPHSGSIVLGWWVHLGLNTNYNSLSPMVFVNKMGKYYILHLFVKKFNQRAQIMCLEQ